MLNFIYSVFVYNYAFGNCLFLIIKKKTFLNKKITQLKKNTINQNSVPTLSILNHLAVGKMKANRRQNACLSAD